MGSKATDIIHKFGILAVRKILKQDFNIPDDGYWVEVSGIIEEICEETKAIPIPSVFADVIVPKKKHTIIDEWHYQATFGNVKQIKKMLGIGDKQTKEIVCSYYKEREVFLRELIENNPIPISETLNYVRFKTSEEKYKGIVDYFIMLVNEEKLHEVTPYMMKQFKFALSQLKQIVISENSSNLRNIRICYSDGCKAIKQVSVFAEV